MTNSYKVLILVLIVIVAYFAVLKYSTIIPSSNILKVSGREIKLEVADTEAKRVMGLSGRKGLDSDLAMLFVFDTEAHYGIWMKDMNFPIDILWLDNTKRVIYAEEHVLPESYPKVFGLSTSSRYVIELKDGSISSLRINLGDILNF